MLFAVQFSVGQQLIDLTLKYNAASTRYEVYAKPNFTQNNFTWGPSQISVVVPNSFPDQALLLTSHAAGSWGDNSKIYAPQANTDFDFHGIDSAGALINFVANQEKLIFSFLSPTGTCEAGLRLFINGSDPSSSAPGMLGGDFSNTISGGNNEDSYGTNYDNGGIVCAPLTDDVNVVVEINVVLYPNPVVDIITISNLITEENTIDVYNYNGKLLRTYKTNESETQIDFTKYADAVYLLKIQNADRNYTIKRIVKNPY